MDYGHQQSGGGAPSAAFPPDQQLRRPYTRSKLDMPNHTADGNSDDLLEHQTWRTLTLKRREPVVNARQFCQHRRQPLVYWRGDFYEWMGTHYRQISADAVTSEVYSFLDCAQVRVPG